MKMHVYGDYGDDSPTGAIGEVLSELAAALGCLIEYFR